MQLPKVPPAKVPAVPTMTLQVAGALLAGLGAGWAVSVHKPLPPPDMACAPLQPLLLAARRTASPGGGAAVPPVQLAFTASSSGPDAAQLASVLKARPFLMPLPASINRLSQTALGTAARAHWLPVTS